MASEINRDDLISDDALRAPLLLAKNFEVLNDQLKQIIDSGLKVSTSQNPESTKKYREETEKLSTEQRELIKIQNQIATQVAKNNDAYRAQEAQLKKVRDEVALNKAKTDDWTKSATAANSSILKLEDALNKNRIAYANLRTEQDRQSETGKNLLKVIQQQAKDQDKLRTSMGQTQQRVGSYAEAFAKAQPFLQRWAPDMLKAQEATEGFGSAVSKLAGLGTIGTIIAGLAAAFGLLKFAVTQYFARTVEGHELELEALAASKAVWSNFLDFMATSIGDTAKRYAVAFTAIAAFVSEDAKESIKIAQKREELLQRSIIGIKKRADSELEANKLLFEAREKLNRSDEDRLQRAKTADKILEDLANRRAKRLMVIYELQVKQNRLDFNDVPLEKLKEESELYRDAIEAQEAYYLGARRRQALISTIEIEIEKRRIEESTATFKNAKDLNSLLIQAEIDKNSAILQNIYSTEKQRYNALQQSAEDQRKLAANTRDKALADADKAAVERLNSKFGADFLLGFDPNDPSTDVGGRIKGMVEAEKTASGDIAKINQEYANHIKGINYKLSADVLANQNLFLKQRLDNELKYFNLSKDLANAWASSEISANERVINSATASIEQRIAAQVKISDEQNKVLENNRDKAIKAADTEAKEKTATDGLALVHQREYEIKRQQILIDYAKEYDALVQQSGVKISKILEDSFNRNITNQKSANKLATDQLLVSLNERFQKGEITLIQYERRKAKIDRDSAKQEQAITIDQNIKELERLKAVLEKRTDLTKEERDLLIKIEQELGDARLTQAELASAKLIKIKEKERDMRLRIEDQIFTTVGALGDDLFAKEQSQIQSRISLIEKSKDRELALAGDNENAKKIITLNAQHAIDVEEKKLKASQHKQAVFDKALSAFEIAIKTAQGIGSALALGPTGIPLAALIGTLGALQEAVVLAKPIPQYAIGTDSARGGLSMINERGPELLIHNGRAKMYDTPGAIITHIDSGTQILTAEQTARVLKSDSNMSVPTGVSRIEIKAVLDDSRLVNSMQAIAQAMPDVIAQSSQMYKVIKHRDGTRKHIRYKIFGY